MEGRQRYLIAREKTKRVRTRGGGSQTHAIPHGCILQVTKTPKAGAGGPGTCPTTHFSPPQMCQGVAASPLQRAQCSFFLQESTYGYPTWGPHRDPLCVETQMGAGEAVGVGVYCGVQMGMQGNSSKNQQAPSCKEAPQRRVPSSPSAVSKGYAKLPEMHQDFGRSREM